MNTFFYKDIAYPDGVIGGKDYYNPVIYSTTERVIGVWEDNKPLYQKTLVIYNSSVVDSDRTITTIDSTFRVKNWKAFSIENGVTYKVPYVAGTGNASFYFRETGNVEFTIRNTSFAAGSYFYITIEYTKTTDTAGSAPYNNYGVPTVRYTTDEQIIGLWADGKPLYRRVLTNIDNTPQNYWIDLGNVEEWNIINLYGMATYNDSNYLQVIPIPNYNNVNANYYTRLYYITNGANAISGAPSNPIIWVENGSDQTRYYTIINHLIMEYTKTTD